jgi:Bacterial SH3 domain
MSRLIRGIIVLATLLAAIVITPGVSQASLSSPARGTTIRATEVVNLRAGPSTSDEIMATAVPGDTATVLNTAPTNGFYRVGYQGKVGWTHGDYWSTTAGLVVNGHQLLPNEEAAVRWIAANTMPRVAGTLSERLTLVSRVSWWSLKEGVLGLANPHSYSHCNNGDKNPLATCPVPVWQVGIAAAQQQTFTLSQTEAVATQLYPGWTVHDVLAHTATYAGYPAGTAGYNQIVNSADSFRNSWLLRNHGVGFTLNAGIVTNECVSNSYLWCYGNGWPETAWYAPNRTAAMRAIGELRSILYALAPA